MIIADRFTVWLFITYRRWKDVLERTVSELDHEIAALSDSKDALEQALEAKNLPTEVNAENLVTREGRRDVDVVEDEVEDQLQKVRIADRAWLFLECMHGEWSKKVSNLF